jgi:signal transduction histidine kinase
MAPLKEGERPLGLLSLARRNALPYAERDLNTASLLGPHVAKLLERARLYEQLKESYAQLNRAQVELVRHERLAALGELSAVMAHEVRNPLGVIFNSVASLKKLMQPSGDAALLLRIVGEEAERLNRIVGDLLDFARPYEPERKAVPLEAIIAGAVDAAVQAVAGEGIRVLTDFPLELPRFAVDGQLVRQAVVNLVVNAMQAMPKGGTVTVRATGEQQPGGELYACIQVRDEGVGISATAAGRIFEPFFTTKATGTGLGLAVVKRIVDAHHGEISVESSPAGGTTFTVRLPGGEAAA